MSLLTQSTQVDYSEKSTAKYLEECSYHLAANTIENKQTELKAFSLYCFEKLSRWDAKNMYLVDADIILRELIFDIKKEDRAERLLPILQKYIYWRHARGFSASSLRTGFGHIPQWLFWCGIKLDQRDLKALKYPKVHKKSKYSLTMHENQEIISFAKHDRKKLYLALISSGMRIGEALSVQKQHMRWVDGYFFVLIPSENSKTASEREVILSSEATAIIKPIYDSVGPLDRIFMKDIQPNVQGEAAIFARSTNRLGIGTPEKHPTLHRERAFFYKMAAKTVDSEYAHMMLGHEGYMMTYAEITDEEKLDYYKKVEPEITVQDYYKNKLKNTTLEDQIRELQLKLDVVDHKEE